MPEVPASAYGPPAQRHPAKTTKTITAPSCWKCGRVYADYLTPPFSLRCPRCKSQNKA